MKTGETLLEIFLCINEKQPCSEKEAYEYLFGGKDKKISFRNFQRYIEVLAKYDFIIRTGDGPERNEKGRYSTSKKLVISKDLIEKLNK